MTLRRIPILAITALAACVDGTAPQQPEGSCRDEAWRAGSYDHLRCNWPSAVLSEHEGWIVCLCRLPNGDPVPPAVEISE